jgi:myo-inositol-1(or 4)-monophosphatase
MIEFMRDLAVEAGKLSLAEFGRLRQDDIEYKNNDKDIVTAADKAVEKFIFEQVYRAYPDYDFFGEESGVRSRQSDYCWVIDPIDGTAAFASELPAYAVSIALQYRGETVKAAVYAPRLGELFWAEKGQGAYLNSRRLRVSTHSRLSDSMLATGFACLRAGLEDNNLKYFNRIAPLVRGIHRYGSAAIDLCYVAAGRFDAYWELALQPYDYAGGVLLVTEAGGKVYDFAGGKDFSGQGIIATNGVIDRELCPFLKD